MAKSTVTRLFVGSIIASIVAVLIMVAAIVVVANEGFFDLNSSQPFGANMSPLATVMIAVAFVSVFVLAGAAIVYLVAWIGAMLNTSHLADKTWFILLLVLGLIGLGVIIMIVYVISGPDGLAPENQEARPPA